MARGANLLDRCKLISTAREKDYGIQTHFVVTPFPLFLAGGCSIQLLNRVCLEDACNHHQIELDHYIHSILELPIWRHRVSQYHVDHPFSEVGF